MHSAPFCPFRYLAQHWPGWVAKFTRLHGFASEVFDNEAQLILIDPGEDDDAFALAHAVAHLEAGDHLSDDRVWSAQMEQDANDVAELWLSASPLDLFDEVPVDGEPTITQLA